MAALAVLGFSRSDGAEETGLLEKQRRDGDK